MTKLQCDNVFTGKVLIFIFTNCYIFLNKYIVSEDIGWTECPK